MGFVILACMAVGATVLGYIIGKKSDLPSMPVWQLILIIVVEIIASYFIVQRMS